MANVAADPAQGEDLFWEDQEFYAHDGRADSMSGGAYDHNELEFSAHEAESWCDLWRYWLGLSRSGMTAAPVYNGTGGALDAGTLLYPTGYNAANAALTVAKADPSDPAKPAVLVLAADLADATAGHAFAAVAVEDIDTSSASAVGDPVYSSDAAGAWALTAPTGAVDDKRVLGVVTAKHATEGSIWFFPGLTRPAWALGALAVASTSAVPAFTMAAGADINLNSNALTNVEAGSFAIAALDLDGATDIGADLADADLLFIDDGAGGTNRKCAMSRVKTYAQGIKLDDFAATDDNTDLNASTAKHGLCPKGDNDTTHFLRGDMSWAAPAGGPGIISAAATYYVSPTGNDTTGDGSSGTPWATIQHAHDYLLDYWLSADVTIELADGDYRVTGTAWNCTHPQGDRITVAGENAHAKSVTSVQSSSAATVALYHCEGLDGATSGAGFADSSAGGTAHDLTAAGDAQIDTAVYKFGTSALLFDGDDDANAAANADFEWGADFGLEMWFYNTDAIAGTSEDIRRLWGCGDNASQNGAINFGFGSNPSYWGGNGEKFNAWIRNDSGTNVDFTSSVVDIGTNEWHHVLLTRHAGTLYIFFDGALVHSTASVTYSIGRSDATAYLGKKIYGATPGEYFTGSLDEVRVVKGVSPIFDPLDPLYIRSGDPSDGFTPPTAAYSDLYTWLVTVNLDSVADIAEDDIAVIDGASGGSNPSFLAGAHWVTDVDAVNTRITVKTAHQGSSAPSGAVEADCTILKSMVIPTQHGITSLVGRLAQAENLAIVGPGTATYDGAQAAGAGSAVALSGCGLCGFRSGLRAETGGVVTLSGHGAVSGCASGLYASGGQVDADGMVSSGCTYGIVSTHAGRVLAVGAVLTGHATYGAQGAVLGLADATSATFSGNGTDASPAVNTLAADGAYIKG